MRSLLLVPVLLLATTAASQPTRPERTGYAETSSLADVRAFVDELQPRHPFLRQEVIGSSAGNLPLLLVSLANPPVTSPAEAQRRGVPIVYVKANIHGGEVEGKESVQMLMRDLAGPEGERLLSRIVLLIVPIFNVDGNEALGPGDRNRPGQQGPAVVGRRPNAQGFDLNRDAIKAEAPETRAVLEAVYRKWEPDVVVDLHTTNGTRHGYGLTYSPPLNPNTPPAVLRFTRDEMLPAIRRELRERHGLETFDYGNAVRRGEATVWETFAEEGRYVTNYAGLRGRIGVLSEATSYLPFEERIVATNRFLRAVLEYVAARPEEVLAATRPDHASRPPELGVRFELASRGEEPVLLERPAPAGERRTGTPTDLLEVRMPVFDRFRPTRKAAVPVAYLIPPTETDALRLLREHGIVVERLREGAAVTASAFVLTEAWTSPNPFQSRRLRRLEGRFESRTVHAEPGWSIVRTDGPLRELAFHLLEPEGLDGLAGWGYVGADLEPGQTFPILKLDEVPAVAAER